MWQAGAFIVLWFSIAGCKTPGESEIEEGNRLAAAGNYSAAAATFRVSQSGSFSASRRAGAAAFTPGPHSARPAAPAK